MVHWLFTWPRTRTRTVPVLLTPHGSLTESTAIVRFADRRIDEKHRLFPSETSLDAEVTRLVETFDAVVGTTTRRLAYCYLVDHPELFVKSLGAGAGVVESAILRSGQTAFRATLKRAFKVSERAKERLQKKLETTLEPIADRLKDGRPYLMGERFTAADLTLISLLGPALRYNQESLSDVPAAFAEVIHGARQSPVGKWAIGVRAAQRQVRVA